MTLIIHPSPELYIKMDGTMSEVGVQRGQREDRDACGQGEFYGEGRT